MFVGAVAELDSVFEIRTEVFVKEFRVTVREVVYSRHRVRPRRDRGSLAHALVRAAFQPERLLEVVDEKFKPHRARPAAHPEPVIRRAHIVRNRPIIATHVKEHAQVVGEIHRIEDDWVRRRRHAVGRAPDEFEIVRIRRGRAHRPRAAPQFLPRTPRRHRAIGRLR